MQVINDKGSSPIKAWVGTKAFDPKTGTMVQALLTRDGPGGNEIPDIEDSAITQLKNIARLPFIARNGVAVMPDVHWGNGTSVGSVIASGTAVIPAAVGVDIGCFRGDTRIPLLDGTQATLKDLANRSEPFWVYSIDQSKNDVAPGRATALLTRRDAEVMRVIVSGGEEIICTPDHRFMLWDGTYKEAKDLKFNDSLMPLYRRWQQRDGYESVSNGHGRAIETHTMVWESINGPLESGHVVHHDNHIHFDNRPENLKKMTASAHSAHHRKVGNKFDNNDPVFQRLRRSGISARVNDPVKRAVMAEVGTLNIKRYMAERPEHFAQAVSGNGARGASSLRTFNTSPRACDQCDVVAKNPSALQWHKRREHASNHKVILTERLSERCDVYCLQVEGHNNFALAAGVFVHNCGMVAVRLSITANDLPDSLAHIRGAIEAFVPVGFSEHNKLEIDLMEDHYSRLPNIMSAPHLVMNWKHITGRDDTEKAAAQLGTLGGGNHFIELCLDEQDRVWIMLHSGSRGIGNKIGTYFIERAKELCERWHVQLPDNDLAFLPAGDPVFDQYIAAVEWAQRYALENRKLMLELVLQALSLHVPGFTVTDEAINCHHNYIARENHFGENLWVTRKGAVRARDGDLGIIPGSMGQQSYIVRGKGNAESYCSCSHGAGRIMGRKEAARRFTIADLVAQTEGVECRKDAAVLDEIPGAYKRLDAVMANQTDLVEVVHTLRAKLCVKGA